MYSSIQKMVIYLFFGCFFSCLQASAQLYNDGGVIKIAAGAALFCSGNITNVAGGTISNDGVLETQGNFLNNGTYNTANNKDSLLLTGIGAITLTTGTASLNNLVVNKTSGGGVTLLSSSTVNTRFDLLAGSFSTNPSSAFEFIAPATTVFNFATGLQVIGKVRRTNWTNNSLVVFHQPNMAVRTAGGTAPTSMLVNMVPGGDPTANEREVKRYFFLRQQVVPDIRQTLPFPTLPQN